MTLGEEICRKYSLTSFRARGGALSLLAINDALEAAARIAEEERSPAIAARIRALKWTADSLPGVSVRPIASI